MRIGIGCWYRRQVKRLAYGLTALALLACFAAVIFSGIMWMTVMAGLALLTGGSYFLLATCKMKRWSMIRTNTLGFLWIIAGSTATASFAF